MINLTDNNTSKTYHREEVGALFSIADKTIAQLCRDNNHLLLFPYSIETADDRIGESPIMTIENTSDPDEVRIQTGNVMGFIGLGNLKIKIKSRFDYGRHDYLLHYMLQKVLSFNLFDLNHNNGQDDVFDFIMFMFPYFLKSAMRQGIYREYQNYNHNDAYLKGTINVGRHIAKNVPFIGNFAYSTREYSYDNSMTELIRHTIEFMKTKQYGQAVLNIDRETTENVQSVIQHTPLYNKNNRKNIISVNLRSKAHPYYTAYTPLQSLCLQILRMDEVKYGETDDEICGILFDGAWLWEEYINTILCNYGFTHPRNKLSKDGIKLFENHRRLIFPDFYKDGIVLDAKYKRLGDYDNVAQVQREDLYQIITYMTRLKVSKGGFIAPLQRAQATIPTSRLKGQDASISIFGVEISKNNTSYRDFCENMRIMENRFVESINYIYNKL